MVPARPLGKYLYAPDGAVIRSGALHTLAELLNAAPVSEGIAYLSGDTLTATEFATAFEVVEALPIKRLARYVRAANVGRLEILKRGVDIDPDVFRKKLKLKGTEAATVVLTRLEGKHAAIIVRR